MISDVSIRAFRLKPGQDLKQGILEQVKANHIQAGFILTCIGSLRRAAIRLADQDEATVYEDKFEIVSLNGVLDMDGGHLHITLADSTGKTFAGHLMDGCLVYTTAEIIIGVASTLIFSREDDAESGYPELVIKRKLP